MSQNDDILSKKNYEININYDSSNYEISQYYSIKVIIMTKKM